MSTGARTTYEGAHENHNPRRERRYRLGDWSHGLLEQLTTRCGEHHRHHKRELNVGCGNQSDYRKQLRCRRTELRFVRIVGSGGLAGRQGHGDILGVQH